MLSRIRPRLTYANVMSSIAVFVVLGGGAYATIDRKIRTADIARQAVGTGKLKPTSVGPGKLKNQAVRTQKIAGLAVETGKIANSAVSSLKIADGAVDRLKLANEAVGFPQLGEGAVIESKIGNGAVSESKIGNGAVSAAKLADGAVIAPKLGTIVTRTNTVLVPNNTQRTVTQSCLAGERLLSGGAEFTSIGTAQRSIIRNARTGTSGIASNTWRATAQSSAGFDLTLRVHAYCLQP